MKNRFKNMKKGTLLLIFPVLLSATAFGQDKKNDAEKSKVNQSKRVKQSASFSLKRKIELNEHKQNEEVSIEIAERTLVFNLTIETRVSSGKVSIEIYDSNGKKEGDFSVGTQLNISISEKASGKFSTLLKEPKAGFWKVKIIPINAKGIINIQTQTYL